MTTVQHFVPRFVPSSMLSELSELWWMSKAYKASRYERMLWTANRFHLNHSEISSTAAYKDLDGMLTFSFGE